MSAKTVGIIGFGSFGKFVAEQLAGHCQVLIYSASGRPNEWAASLSKVAKADYLILCIPLGAYKETLEQIKPMIGADTVIVDVCSVKEKPVQVIKSILPSQKLVATHPLFGPESAESLEGHVMVICPEISDVQAMGEIEQFAKNSGLIVKEMSADEHDKEMATVQGLTFFIARILKSCGLHDMRLSTPSFKRLQNLAELEHHHSDDLFYTIQAGNERTGQIREQFLKIATELNDNINKRKL